VIGIYKLSGEQPAEEVRQRQTVRSRENEQALRLHQNFYCLEKGARLIEVLDELTGDNDLSGLESKRCEIGGTLAVSLMGIKPHSSREPYPFSVQVDPYELSRDTLKSLVKPGSVLTLSTHSADINKTKVYDALPAGELKHVITTVDQGGPRKMVHGVEDLRSGTEPILR
jgi:hypothetical protein